MSKDSGHLWYKPRMGMVVSILALKPVALESKQATTRETQGLIYQWGNVVLLAPGDTPLHGPTGGSAEWGAEPEVQMND